MDNLTLRYQLLEMSREMVTREWSERLRVEEASANYEKRAPAIIRPPTLQRIMATAEKMYVFVTKTPGQSSSEPHAPETEDGLETDSEPSEGSSEEKVVEVTADQEA